MKKFIAFLVLVGVIMTVYMVAFVNASTSVDEFIPQTSTEATTAAPTQKPTQAPTQAPTQKPTEKPTEPPTEAPTEPPTEAPTQAPTEAPMQTPTEPEPIQQPVTNWDSFLNGNTWEPYKTAYNGPKYNLTEQELHQLGWVCYREQGSLEGARMEASLMANLFENYGGNFASVHDYVLHSGWFGCSGDIPTNPDSGDYYSVVKDVLVDGNRYLPSDVVEHDCLSDISSISTGDVYNKDNYIPFVTVINNVYGATYTFIGFAPNGGDPFGFV